MTIEEARGLAAQAWCTPETETIEMDTRLAEAFAQILWKQLALAIPPPSELELEVREQERLIAEGWERRRQRTQLEENGGAG